MLTIPRNSSPFVSMVGIDPASNRVGVSVMTINLETMQIVDTRAWTIIADRLVDESSWMATIHGARLARITVIRNFLLDVFHYFHPFLIASEAPFIHPKHPHAGLALTEAVSGIRDAVIAYNPWIPLEIVPPSNVKNAVGAPGNCDKDEMRRRLYSLAPILHFNAETPIEVLDEHAIDATAVAYSRFKTLVGNV